MESKKVGVVDMEAALSKAFRDESVLKDCVEYLTQRQQELEQTLCKLATAALMDGDAKSRALMAHGALIEIRTQLRVVSQWNK